MKLISYCDQPDHEGLGMFKHSCAEHGWNRISWAKEEGAFRGRYGCVPCGTSAERSTRRRSFCRPIVSTCCSAHHGQDRRDVLEFQYPIVISAERNCWPLANLARRFPTSPTSFKFVCAGTYIGTAGAILKMMDDIGADYLENCADQIELSLWYLGQRKTATLDHHCRIFQCYYMADQVVGFQDGRIFNSETKTYPLVFHANGNHKNRQTHRFYRQLFSK